MMYGKLVDKDKEVYAIMKIVMNLTLDESMAVTELTEKIEKVIGNTHGAAADDIKSKYIKSCEYNKETNGVDVVLEFNAGIITALLNVVSNHVAELHMLYKHGKRLFKSYVDFVMETVGVSSSMKEEIDSIIHVNKE